MRRCLNRTDFMQNCTIVSLLYKKNNIVNTPNEKAFVRLQIWKDIYIRV